MNSAFDWNDDNGAVGPLSRKSFQLHEHLNNELNEEIDYRKLNTLSVRARMKSKRKAKDTNKGIQNIPSECPDWLNGESVTISGVDSIGNTKTTAQVCLVFRVRGIENNIRYSFGAVS